MKSLAGQLVIVIVLVFAGVVLWFAGGAEQRLAAAERTFVTLRYGRAAEELARAAATNPATRVLEEVTGTAAAAAGSRRLATYWAGDYEPFIRADDPALRRLAADAAFRAMRAEGGTWQLVTARLDEIAKRYADVLRDHPEDVDAAYNYEFVIKLRAAVTVARQPIPPVDVATAGLTIHGKAGGPPEGSDTKKFRMIVPMRPDERMEAEQAGRGATKIRKG